MANKNTRNRKLAIRKAGKRGEAALVVERPVFNYHSRGCDQDFRAKRDSFFVNVSFDTSTVGPNDTVSTSKRRNMAMRVYRNQNDDGTKYSLTVHEPFLPREYVTFKNHKYLREDKRGNHYQQFKSTVDRQPVLA